jgi:hypothetical protein
MKSKIFLIFSALIILSAFIFSAIYLYIKLDIKYKFVKYAENNIYAPEEKVNLISDVEPFLFTTENKKLVYDGGPIHWGSRTVTFDNMNKTENSKIVNLHVIDESDMKGELPKKEWNQKWEAKSDGTLYIDNLLMLKYPIVVGQKWDISDYSPIIDSSKTYDANVKITSVVKTLNDLDKEVVKVTTSLTIKNIKTVDGGIYTETRVFESGLGLKELKVTEPTISEFILSYWLQNSNNIE